MFEQTIQESELSRREQVLDIVLYIQQLPLYKMPKIPLAVGKRWQ